MGYHNYSHLIGILFSCKSLRLNFYRQDPSSCLEQVLLPDFNKALDLTLNQTTSVKIVPEKPGEYTFTCGMNMYRGAIVAEALER